MLEVVEDFDGNAYRAVYTVRLRSGIYVLHCFQNKSGIATSKRDLDLIQRRLKLAIEQGIGVMKIKKAKDNIFAELGFEPRRRPPK